MAEIDAYADAFQVTLSPFGVSLTLSVREPHPNPSKSPAVKEVATIRMSIEHLKLMTMMFRQQLLQYERNTGSSIRIPSQIYQQLGIAEEDWGNSGDSN